MERYRGTLPTRVGGRHNMLAGDNELSDRSTILDGPRVGDTGGGHWYQCLWLIGGSACGMEGGFIRGAHYMAGTSHRGGQTGLQCGWQLVGSRLSLWPHRSSETGGASRGPQPTVHDLLWDPTHYRRRLQRYPRS